MHLSLQVGFVLLVVWGVLSDESIRRFQAFRYPPMEGLKPPMEPVSGGIAGSTECAMLCSSDATCTSFSHSAVNKMCMLSPEIIRPYDISISHPIEHWYHFNVHEVINGSQVFLRQGYRWFHDLQMALRFHFYWPLNYNQSQAICQEEGAELVTINNEEKMGAILTAVEENENLRKFKTFFTHPSNFTDIIEEDDRECGILSLVEEGNSTKPVVTCLKPLPYICEMSIPLPSVRSEENLFKFHTTKT
ncbi:hypothetical protein SNE40_004689 [Patella caerulea]|uniref:Apple domain-containing protein n=1 Tax=Patella caerulea TaxID=87958 RepID=A0AAN8Q195_PATCE